MAFSFGAPTAAAPTLAASTSFSFGGATAAAPAFGAPSSAAPSTSLFGSTPAASTTAPSTSLFGGTPAPASGGGGLFGSNPAPAPSTSLFGSTPAPSTGGLFGSTPAAPSTTSLFGAPSSAVNSGGLFGSTQSAAPAFGTAQPQQQQQFQQQQQQHATPLSANTPYSQLPDSAKKTIDSIYQLMMQHRRTLASVKTMAPSLLRIEGQENIHSASDSNDNIPPSSPADAAAGFAKRSSSSKSKEPIDPSNMSLPQQMINLHTQINTLLRSAESNMAEAQQLKSRAGNAACVAKMHGAWPVESVAARRGVALSSVRAVLGDRKDASSGRSDGTSALGGGNGGTASSSTSSGGTPASSLNVSGMNNVDAVALQHMMDVRAASVDRMETMPSPYLWEVLHNFEERVAIVQRDVDAVKARLTIAEEAERVQALGGSGMPLGDETALLLSNNCFAAMASLMMYEGGGIGRQVPLCKQLASLARSQNEQFLRIAAQAARVHEGLEEVKMRYRRFCENNMTYGGGHYEDPFFASGCGRN
eukprot:g11967.t1.1.5e17418b g11967  g11967.t1 contig6:951701-953526(-)